MQKEDISIFNVLSYLENSKENFPDKIAVTDDKKSLTYSEFTLTAQKIGSALVGKLDRSEPVAVFMEKNVDALCAFFGVVYAGGCYSLINTELPEPRAAHIFSVLGARRVITSADLLESARLRFPEAEILTAEQLSEHEINSDALNAARSRTVDADPLYINFTSGSTGTPKGIAVCHRSVIDFIGCFTDLFGFTADDVIANQAPFDFDVSVKDIYSAIKTGATLVVIPRRLFSAPVELIDFLCDRKVTVMTWAVSALCLISTFHALDYKTPETVKKVLFSGEVMPYKHLKCWQEHLPDAMFVNLYGPTEITCNCTYHILQNERDYSGGIPIGLPFPNEDVFLLSDENEKITAPGTAGEICVRGTALALGYYSAPEQTAKHFVQNPLNQYYPELIYRTGDLGMYNDDGELVFSGRKDFQIKYMGHRVELEEIERAMAAIDGVDRCCCIFDEKKSRLKGFYIGTAEKDELRTAMKDSLPAFMIPGTLKKVEDIPLTKNGKIDRKRLAESGGK